jgi:hypothetical protein
MQTRTENGEMGLRAALFQTRAVGTFWITAALAACAGSEADGAPQGTDGAPRANVDTSDTAGGATGDSESGDLRATPAPGMYRGAYTVPVPDDLAPYAEFEIDPIEVRVQDGELELRYRMPALLLGEAPNVSFRGAASTAGEYLLEGDYGSATCAPRGTVFRCDEVLRDMEPEADKVAEALSQLSEREAEGRLAVSEHFAVDPIGVLSFDMTP